MSLNSISRVGLMTDLHYDGSAIAMNRLYSAVTALNAGGVERLVVMGDLAQGDSEFRAKRQLREIAALCDAFQGEVYFMPGNHDLDHLSKAEFYNALGRAGDAARFHFEVGGYEFICLDGNYRPDGVEYDCGNFEWEQAFVPEEELEWLRARLATSLKPVIVLSHQRLDTETRFAVRNHAAVRDVIALGDKVRAVFHGHNHEDDLNQISGTSYYTLDALVNDAGPAVLELNAKGVRLLRDFHPAESP